MFYAEEVKSYQTECRMAGWLAGWYNVLIKSTFHLLYQREIYKPDSVVDRIPSVFLISDPSQQKRAIIFS